MRRPPRLVISSVAALGVVYGDIGTSPLYAVRECFHGPSAVPLRPADVLGVLSLVLWSLIFVISVKYLLVVMRADNDGEGGILALLALASRGGGAAARPVFLALGLFGAGLLYGDGMITPAISVLSAVEGLRVAAPGLGEYIVPAALVILLGLFLVQRRGTGGVGVVFGPVMLLWFGVLIAVALPAILRRPDVLAAVSPHHAGLFLLRNRAHGFLILGVVFLVVTGGEALYADLGHFGARPIRTAWFALVFPALVINYFGQGALLLADPEAAANPFYLLAPAWARYPLVLLATAATVIASQAVISGAFSLGRQAMALGYSPRLEVVHTSHRERGQVYLPAVNWGLFVAVIGLVVFFRSSSNLAAAYGIAVSCTMLITTVLLHAVARERWGWPWLAITPIFAVFLVVDLSFLGANVVKIAAGGWFPILVGIAAGTMMATWKRGRDVLARNVAARTTTEEEFLRNLKENPPRRVPGSAVYLTAHLEGIPVSLAHNMRRNGVLHEHVAVLTFVTEREPRVPESWRVRVTRLGEGVHRIVARYGYMERPGIEEILGWCARHGLPYSMEESTFFVGRETIEVTRRPPMPRWQKQLFVWMSRNSRDASAHFDLPPDRVVEIGVLVEL